MQICRARVDESAAPLVVVACDGAFYDLAALEERWGYTAWGFCSDFHTRVFALKSAGIGEVDARLRSGDRPTEARLPPETMLPLAPCETDHVSYLYAAPRDYELTEPRFERRDARALLGDGLPVPVPIDPAAPITVEIGLSAVLGEELEGADAAEAGRALYGYCLSLGWSAGDRWYAPTSACAPNQLGPWITTGLSPHQLARIEASLSVGDARRHLGTLGAWRFHPFEILAYVSRSVCLRPGDVIGLGAIGRVAVRYGERVCVAAHGLGSLTGWATPAGPPPDWRLKNGR